MIDEYALEDDVSNEFKGGTLSINQGSGKSDNTPKPSQEGDQSKLNINNSCYWGSSLISPFKALPTKISETIWTKKPEETPVLKTSQSTGTLQHCLVNIPEDPNSYFTYREGVVENAVRECKENFLDEETDGPLLAYFLLTQINHWDIDKERLVLLTPKVLVTAKYDFIALKRLGCKKLPLQMIEQIYIGDLLYPNGSLIPRLNGFADGLSNILENCIFSRSKDRQFNNFYQTRDRNMRGVRLAWTQERSSGFVSKWNPFNSDVPFFTFTYHPLYFHKDCTNETQRNTFNLDLFIEKLCLVITEKQGSRPDDHSCRIFHKSITLDNYVGLGSLIHNRNGLGFFKVRGKFSF